MLILAYLGVVVQRIRKSTATYDPLSRIQHLLWMTLFFFELLEHVPPLRVLEPTRFSLNFERADGLATSNMLLVVSCYSLIANHQMSLFGLETA
jgi:hypothetical protein